MRVITAIYLHVRPELRDEWLAGLHDATAMGGAGGAATGGAGGQQGQDGGDMEDAVPLEWALRGLTFWWMKRAYPDTMRLKLNNNARPTETPVTSEGSDEMKGHEAGIPADWTEGGGQEIEEEERDFFQRELDRMGWGVAALGLGAGEDGEFGEEAPGVDVAMNHDVNMAGDSATVGESRPLANGVVQQQLPIGESRAVNGDIIE